MKPMLVGPWIMLLSAAIFGYFGFYNVTFNTTGVNGQYLVYVAILEWTLKVSAVGFAIAGVLAFFAPMPANLLYSVMSLLGAVAFVVVVVMDLMDPNHIVMSPLILLLFAAWNGYGAINGLRDLLFMRQADEGSWTPSSSWPGERERNMHR
jgi:hypothetical protein